MTLLVPDVGEQKMLQHIMNKTAPEDLRLRLFQNNITPGETDVLGTYTESTGPGYAAVSLTGASWTVSSTAGPTSASYAQQTFTFTGAANSIYGYYVTQANSSTLMWAERFSDGPYAIVNNGDAVKITPVLELA